MVGDWVLVYPGVELAFGTRESGYGFDSAPALATTESSIGDVALPNDDGILFGRDRLHGQSIVFEIDVVAVGDRAGVKAKLEVLRNAWRADVIRRDPGAVAMLQSDTGRVTFGRPRRFVSADDDDRFGISKVTADFMAATDLWYGPEQSTSVSIAPAVGGGLVAPLVAPLATTESSDRSTAVTVGGSLPTWPVFEVRGPISGPVVELVGQWALRFPNLSLAYDQTLVVDARPWARTILRDGESVAGMLAPSSARLQDAVLPPGTHELVLRGTSLTGTASLTARWRDAYTTP